MLSKNQIKYINSLQQKKFRLEHQSFVVEGAKSVIELLKSDFEIELLFVTKSFFKENEALLQNLSTTPEVVEENELEKVGSFSSIAEFVVTCARYGMSISSWRRASNPTKSNGFRTT